MVSLPKTSLTQCIKAARLWALATTAHNHLSTNKKQLTKETHSVSDAGLAELNKEFLSELCGHSKLWMFKHITSLQKCFNIHTSLQVTFSVLRRVLLNEKLYVYWEETWLMKHLSYKLKLEFLTHWLKWGYPGELAIKHFSRSTILIMKKGSTKQSKNIDKYFAFHYNNGTL